MVNGPLGILGMWLAEWINKIWLIHLFVFSEAVVVCFCCGGAQALAIKRRDICHAVLPWVANGNWMKLIIIQINFSHSYFAMYIKQSCIYAYVLNHV